MLGQFKYIIRSLIPPSGSILLRMNNLQDYESVLDIGCGKNSVLKKFENNFKLGIDAFEDYIEISKSKKIHHEYILGNINEIDLDDILPNFQAVVIFDLLEHLTESEATKLIENIEKFNNIKFIAIKTPSSYINQDVYDNNIYQIHKSSLPYSYFKNKGYKVYGCDGSKFFYVDGENVIKTQSIFRGILGFLTMPIFLFLPNYSLNYLAILKR